MNYDQVVTQLTVGADKWNATNIKIPEFVDKNDYYNLIYPHKVFIQVYEAMPIKEISKDDVFNRKQFSEIHGVYGNYADAALAIKETSRSLTAHKGWRLGGKTHILKKKKVFLFVLIWFELAFLRAGEW